MGQSLMLKAFPEDRPAVICNIFILIAFDQRNKSVGSAVVQVVDGGEPVDGLRAVSEEPTEKRSDVFLGLVGCQLA